MRRARCFITFTREQVGEIETDRQHLLRLLEEQRQQLSAVSSERENEVARRTLELSKVVEEREQRLVAIQTQAKHDIETASKLAQEAIKDRDELKAKLERMERQNLNLQHDKAHPRPLYKPFTNPFHLLFRTLWRRTFDDKLIIFWLNAASGTRPSTQPTSKTDKMKRLLQSLYQNFERTLRRVTRPPWTLSDGCARLLMLPTRLPARTWSPPGENLPLGLPKQTSKYCLFKRPCRGWSRSCASERWP